MGIPRYESKRDRENEAELAKMVGEAFGWEPIKMHDWHVIDWMFCVDKKLIAWVEAKCRNYTWEQMDRWGGFYISLDKVGNGCVKAKMTKKPFYLIVKDSSGDVRWKTLASPDVTYFFENVEYRGRSDRPNDPKAIEPCAMFHSSEFEPFPMVG